MDKPTDTSAEGADGAADSPMPPDADETADPRDVETHAAGKRAAHDAVDASDGAADAGVEGGRELRLSTPARAAGGWRAIGATLRHTSRELGLFRGARMLLQLNQPDGFDCPGCAWPDPQTPHRLEFCENGVKHVAHEATKKRVGPAFFEKWPVPVLARQSDRWLESQGRLTEPMVRRTGSDHYEPIAWEEAFELIGEQLRGLEGPDQAIYYTSGRTSNEAAFLFQLMARRLGTNNLPDCSNMCHESSGKGLSAVLGVGKGTVSLADFDLADAIFIAGQNPGTNHPRMLATLQDAARRGCRIVSINPLREPGLVRFKHPKEPLHLFGHGTELAELFLQVRVNGDVALLQGMAKAVLEEEAARPSEVLDRSFINSHTTGFETYKAAIERTSWEVIEEASGVDREAIWDAANIYVEADRTIVCWAMGLTQHKNGVANVQEVVNLLLLRGNLGRPGAGACPVRGHSNVQGDRTVGICEAPSRAFLDRLGRALDFEPPRKKGLNTVEAIQAMHDGRARVFIAMGGNFVAATPDSLYTAEALRKCDLTVQISTKLNRSHLVTGAQALILPCLSRVEEDVRGGGTQFVSVENSMGVVHSSRGRFPPASEHLLSEPAIVAGMARAALDESTGVDWELLGADYDRIRDLIEAVVDGFDDYNERVRRPGGFVLPNGARERQFATESGKAEFTVHSIPRHELAPDQYLMMTIRSHDQFNTTIYSDDDRYRGIRGERRVVLLNPHDMAEASLIEGQSVDLISHFDGQQRIARGFLVVPYELPRRSAATYFPEANVLVPLRHYADISHTPASKSVIISIEPRE